MCIRGDDQSWVVHTGRTPKLQHSIYNNNLPDCKMEAFDKPVRQLTSDLSAFENTVHSTVGSDRLNVLTTFKAFVSAVEAFARDLHYQLQNEVDHGISAALENETATSMTSQKENLLLQSKHMTKAADAAVTSIKSLKRLALDLQHRAYKLREVIDQEREKATQRSKVDQADVARIEKELEQCLASMSETNAKLQKLEKDAGEAKEARTAVRVVSITRDSEFDCC
jgi:hypothetical protein